ncbi:DUF2141 domain-containing protein [Winogradskyella aurantiaca]|uniref:DUF2141 domain-containing protein n=1 Tax=Winogradskyella aurantiaca TaxID=2219558 RepID=UPI000E1CC54C|nr:DUF2141 domain-containing protein [Winogradskyella aurantiaca]
MILLTKYLLIYLFSVMSSVTVAQNTYSIEVTIENLKSDDGKVLVGLYNTEKDFLEDTFMGEVGVIKDKTTKVVFNNVPSGTYAVSYIHDANDNDKMDTNFMGIPKEGYGCSNNAKGFMGPPKWEDAKFELTESISITIN